MIHDAIVALEGIGIPCHLWIEYKSNRLNFLLFVEQQIIVSVEIQMPFYKLDSMTHHPTELAAQLYLLDGDVSQ